MQICNALCDAHCDSQPSANVQRCLSPATQLQSPLQVATVDKLVDQTHLSAILLLRRIADQLYQILVAVLGEDFYFQIELLLHLLKVPVQPLHGGERNPSGQIYRQVHAPKPSRAQLPAHRFRVGIVVKVIRAIYQVFEIKLLHCTTTRPSKFGAGHCYCIVTGPRIVVGDLKLHVVHEEAQMRK